MYFCVCDWLNVSSGKKAVWDVENSGGVGLVRSPLLGGDSDLWKAVSYHTGNARNNLLGLAHLGLENRLQELVVPLLLPRWNGARQELSSIAYLLVDVRVQGRVEEGGH